MLIQFSSLLYVDHSDESPGNSQSLLKSLFLFQEVYVIHDGYALSVFAMNPLQGAPAASLFNRTGHVHLCLLIAPVVAVELYLPSSLSVFIQSIPKPIKKRYFSFLTSFFSCTLTPWCQPGRDSSFKILEYSLSYLSGSNLKITSPNFSQIFISFGLPQLQFCFT